MQLSTSSILLCSREVRALFPELLALAFDGVQIVQLILPALLPLLLPFLSPKSFHKLHPLPSLLTLYHTHHVPLRGLEPTPEVLLEESRILRERPDLHPVASRREAWRDEARHAQRGDASWTGTVRGMVGAAGSYLTLPRWGGPLELEKEVQVQGRRGYWGRSVEELVSEGNGKMPKLLVDLRKAILGQCTAAEGVFRRTSNVSPSHICCSSVSVPLIGTPQRAHVYPVASYSGAPGVARHSAGRSADPAMVGDGKRGPITTAKVVAPVSVRAG